MNVPNLTIFAVVVLLSLSTATATLKGFHALPRIKVNASSITLSGFDSGAIFATQFQFAYSTVPKAVGVMGGVPYLCGQGNLESSTECMETPYLESTSSFVDQAKTLESEGKIDGLGNLTTQFAMVYAAKDDSVVAPLCSQMLVNMYNDFNLAKVSSTLDKKTEHSWVTSQYGSSCNNLGKPYVNQCDWSFADKFLTASWEFMGLSELKKPHPSGFISTNLYTWDQTAYGGNVIKNSMDTTGYIYIPTACNNTGKMCHLHVHFHGCDQGRQSVGGDAYVRQTQINEYAETNDIIVLYPQVAPNAARFNDMGCWDWFGYNNDNFFYLEYATRNGIQNRMIKMVIDDLVNGYW